VSDAAADFRYRRDGVTIPTIWVAFALSLLLHLALLWQWLPHLRLLSPDETKLGDGKGSLIVHLAPSSIPPPSPRLPVPPPAPKIEAPPKSAAARPPLVPARPRPARPVIALTQPQPDVQAAPTEPELVPAAPTQPPAEGDLASFIQARRSARGQPPSRAGAANAPPVEDDRARSERIVAANLGSQRAPTFGYDPSHSGGVFQIVRMGYDYAEFMFFGWNKDIRRNTRQQIEVRKGGNSDIRLAVVRKMISIIREYEQEDFRWESQRLGRAITLSARARDNAGLEEFMLREFFGDARVPQ
jgi:outer membrane biosynthesis protein TonB